MNFRAKKGMIFFNNLHGFLISDCVEVFTPFSAFSHLGNGQGLFRSAKALQPYVQEGLELNPIMVKAILEGLQEFQDKISEECLADDTR